MKMIVKRLLTSTMAVIMCAGMMITEVQAVGNLENNNTDTVLEQEQPPVEPIAPETPGSIEPEQPEPEPSEPVLPEQPTPESMVPEQPVVQQPIPEQPLQRPAVEVPQLEKNLEALASGRMTMSDVRTQQGAIEAKARDATADAAELVLEITDGTIIFSEGGYKQGAGEKKIRGDETYTITGSTTDYKIIIEEGANPKLTFKTLNIDLSSVTTANASPIDVAPGTAVSITVDGGCVLTGGSISAGIRLQNRSAVMVKGFSSAAALTQKLTITGGAGAYAVGNHDQQGGNFGVEDESVQVLAYSNRTDKAMNVQNMYTKVKILQGALDTTVVSKDTTQKVGVENRNDRAKKYDMQLPIGYASFATTTTLAGGEYVAYFPDEAGKVKDSTLLIDASSKYVYGLGSVFTASLSGLMPEKVHLSATFEPNGKNAAFENGKTKEIVTGIGYGTTLTGKVPANPKKENNAARNWCLDADGEMTWNMETGEVVKDMVFYMDWQPEKCTVTFYPKTVQNNKAFEKQYKYDTLIPESDVTVQNGDYAPDGWYTDKGVRWNFNTDKVKKEEINLTARWLAPCKITFDKNAADATNIDPAVVTVPATTTVTDPETHGKKPTRPGYIFKGWYTEALCKTAWDFSDKVMKSTTLYAKWVAENTKVTFDPGTGGGIATKEVAVQDGFLIPKPPKDSIKMEPREQDKNGNMGTNYVFVDWYEDAKFTKKWDFSTPLSTPDGELTLYAKWRQEVCWVTFNAKDAQPEEQVIDSLGYGKQLVEADWKKKFQKTGHTILRWMNKTQQWNFDTELTEDVVLDAIWTPEQYEVTFNVTDEDAPKLDANEQKQTPYYQNPVTKPVYPKADAVWPGHTFNGWFTQDEGKGTKWIFRGEAEGTPTLVEGNTNLYAHWTKDEYFVTWDKQNGEKPEEDKSKIYYYGYAIEEPVKPVRENYIFEGWFTDVACTQENKWDFEKDQIKSSMTLYAKWVGEPRKLTLHITYETVEEGGDGKTVTQDSIEVRYGDLINRADLEKDTNENTAPRPGYTLKGWYTDEERQNEWEFETDTITEDQNLYAYWIRNVYNITFYTYEGDKNPIEPQTSYHDGKVTKPKDPVREHYTFDTWYIDTEHTTKWNFTKDVVTDHLDLRAKWIPDIYTLSFETDGGSKLDPVKVTYGTYPEDSALATKKVGYLVKAWYRDKEKTTPFDPKTELVDGNMTIYVEWKLEEFTVTFHFQAAQGSPEEEVVIDETPYNVGHYVKEPSASQDYMKLSPWYKDKDCKERWVFKRDKIKTNLDLYAYWSDIEYNIHFETYDGTQYEDEKLIWGDLLTQPEVDPERNGYSFTGWFKDSSQKVAWDFVNDIVEGDTTIFAGWTANMYTITFELNGGVGSVEPQKLVFGSMIAEPTAPTKEGFTFTGWKVAAKTRAAAGDVWNFATDAVDGDATLTAEWEEVEAAVPPAADNTTGGTTAGNTATGNGTTSNASGTGTGTTGTGTGTADNSAVEAAKKALETATSNLQKILTGDKAPLTYSLAGIFVGAFMIIWTLIRRFK